MNTRTQYDDDDERERGLLRDGERRRVPTYLMDSVQRALAVSDAYGRSSDAALSRPGPRFAPELTQDSNGPDHDELREFADAERAAEWKGGLQVGDRVDLGKRSFVVDQRDVDGRTRLALDRRSAEEIKEQAYQTYDSELQNAWRGSDMESMVVNEGGRSGRMVGRNIGSSTDSLPELVEQHRVATDAAYRLYDEEIANAWKTP
ncbi:MAG: hypothetical protein U1E81_13855 [Xanthobacteraceae bacterium]